MERRGVLLSPALLHRPGSDPAKLGTLPEESPSKRPALRQMSFCREKHDILCLVVTSPHTRLTNYNVELKSSTKPVVVT